MAYDENGLSVGTWLKEARTERNISIEQVARDTFISIRLIQALEDERYDEFVSEVYLVGFLKSYANYLGINSDQIVQRFRNIRMQEQPTPIDELLQKQSRAKKPILITLAVLVFAVGLSFLVGRLFFPDYLAQAVSLLRVSDYFASNRSVVSDETEIESSIYTLDNGFLEREFRVGDSIDLSTEGEKYTLVVRKISRFVRLESLEKEFRVRLENSERADILIDNEGGARAELLVRSITRDSSPPTTVLRIRMQVDNLVLEDAASEQQLESTTFYGNTTVASRKRVAVNLDIREVGATFPVQIEFTAPVFLQYQADNQAPVSNIYDNGDIINLDPEQVLSVWATNAGAVVFQIVDRFIPIGESGEVNSFTIEKRLDTATGQNNLQIIPLY